MSEQELQDEASGFVCESEDVVEVEAPSVEVEQEEQASSESEAPNVDDEVADAEKADLLGTDTAAEQDLAKKPNRVQKRIDEVVRQREDEKRKNESLENRIKELEGKQSKLAQVTEPKEADFDSYDDYLDAVEAFDDQSASDKNATDSKSEVTNADSSNEMTQAQKTALAITQERIEATETPDDFDSVVMNQDLQVTGDMLEALAECDDPAKVMYHLGKNQSLAADIAGKTSVQQMRAIAKLDLTIASKPANITNAPDAISPVNGSDSQKKSHTEMSFAEFEADDRARNSARKSTW